jgi:hypothetical protein
MKIRERQSQHRSPASSRTSAGIDPLATSSDKLIPLPTEFAAGNEPGGDG